MKSSAELAEAAAAVLNADEVLDLDGEPIEFSIRFEAKATNGPPNLNRTLGTPSVSVYGVEQNEEPPFDRGGTVKATRVLNVLLECPLNERFDLAMCQVWLEEVKEAFRELRLFGDRWYHENNETVTPYDDDERTQHKRFVSLFRATFFDFA